MFLPLLSLLCLLGTCHSNWLLMFLTAMTTLDVVIESAVTAARVKLEHESRRNK